MPLFANLNNHPSSSVAPGQKRHPHYPVSHSQHPPIRMTTKERKKATKRLNTVNLRRSDVSSNSHQPPVSIHQ
ncbi:hypothetical protein CONLIGDRAFT_294176 [Coniochaeta ligniaria NRRL 30616]|uniref:Uncharacterized protein n=1 Tax=Coniochaeta ligniaria NRRL 30616 TaxID=1408157 RepID=A0A1J7JM31_9PEZI|nr:hypothetical protein CONLIGDRAFT_294176 [Coniochaeta ligniaria NRRL 30616]